MSLGLWRASRTCLVMTMLRTCLELRQEWEVFFFHNCVWSPAGSTLPFSFNQNSYPRTLPGERTRKEGLWSLQPKAKPGLPNTPFFTDPALLQFFRADLTSYKSCPLFMALQSTFYGTARYSDSGLKELARSGWRGEGLSIAQAHPSQLFHNLFMKTIEN